MQESIESGELPGVVLQVEQAGEVFQHVAGWRAVVPAAEVMTEDTIFDVASLTKVVAALISGEMDICPMSGFTQVLVAIERGASLKIVGGAAIKNFSALMSGNPVVRTLKDLEGRAVGVGALGTTAGHALPPQDGAAQDLARSLAEATARLLEQGGSEGDSEELKRLSVNRNVLAALVEACDHFRTLAD